MPERSLRKPVPKPKTEKTEAKIGREQRMKYADMARASGHMTKREAEDFGNERKVKEWEADFLADRNSASGRAREKERTKTGAQIQGKLNRMANERGHLDTKDYDEFDAEVEAGQMDDNRGKSTGKATFFISKNPLAKD